MPEQPFAGKQAEDEWQDAEGKQEFPAEKGVHRYALYHYELCGAQGAGNGVCFSLLHFFVIAKNIRQLPFHVFAQSGNGDDGQCAADCQVFFCLMQKNRQQLVADFGRDV